MKTKQRTSNHSTAGRNYDVQVLSEGRTYQNAEVFTARKDSNYFNTIREQAEQKYPGPDQFVKIDHVSRLIVVNY